MENRTFFHVIFKSALFVWRVKAKLKMPKTLKYPLPLYAFYADDINLKYKVYQLPEPYKTMRFAVLLSAQTACARFGKKRDSAIHIRAAGIFRAKP